MILNYRYMVNVLAKGKVVGSYMLHSLEELVSILLKYGKNGLKVFDFEKFRELTDAELEEKLKFVWDGFKASLKPQEKKKKTEQKTPQKRHNKRWKTPVLCVERDLLFPSVRDCAEYFHLPHKAIWNAIRFGTMREGYHFVIPEVPKKKETEEK